MDMAQAVNDQINWTTLRKCIERDIRICEQVAAQGAHYEPTVTRQNAKIEALRAVLADMATLEQASDR